MDMSDPDLAVSIEDALRQTGAAIRRSNTLPLWISSSLTSAFPETPSSRRTSMFPHYTQRLQELVPDMKLCEHRVGDPEFGRRICALILEVAHHQVDPERLAHHLNRRLSRCRNEGLRRVSHFIYLWPIIVSEFVDFCFGDTEDGVPLQSAFPAVMLRSLTEMVFTVRDVDLDPAIRVQRTLACLRGVKDAAEFLPDERRLVILSEISMLEEILHALLKDKGTTAKEPRRNHFQQVNPYAIRQLCVKERAQNRMLEVWNTTKERIQTPFAKERARYSRVERTEEGGGGNEKESVEEPTTESVRPTLDHCGGFNVWTPLASFPLTERAERFKLGWLSCVSAK
ncbi:MAG: hypothetical protein KVP17_001718 [Porospora cf. gigantea B]|uniref:uncharacterized protein n=1 Tax=Porospora cf. gigantea B TaxID=2853592 RepID=UPI003571AD1A|nr:MAG: hypothetical protein KVP17_001718 [Porospora cf. gigantea B]